MAEEDGEQAGILMCEPAKTASDDLKGVIKKVLTAAKSSGALKKMGMKEGGSIESYFLGYDAPTSQLESIYFWLLDFIQDMGIDTRKITDNFMSSPGSGHFMDMSQRQSKFRQEAMNAVGVINQIIKSVIILLYDLKEFEISLGHYKDAVSSNPDIKDAGLLSLKQIWLDNVDIKKGNTSIKAMTFSQAPFSTLIDAFMIINNESLKDSKGNELDLNDRVKRVLKQRVVEFKRWRELSEKELKKRFEVQKAYLKSQVETMKLYTSWARPYLKAAEQLRMKGFGDHPALVNAFSTTMFDLVLFGKQKLNFNKSIESSDLPSGFKGYKLKRDYYSCFIVAFNFRGHVAQKVTQKGDYGFAVGGKADVIFDCYALNEDELNLIDKKLTEQNVEEALGLIQDTTDKSLEELKEDIDHFLDDKDKIEETKKEKKQDDINPFSALFGLFKFDKKEKVKGKITDAKKVKKDNFVEEAVRKLAAKNAKDMLYAMYDIYKKAHGMASAPEEGFNY